MTAAARMQRWALFLGGHRYKIEFKSTLNHANADGLSRLPLDTATGTKGDKESVAMFTLMQIESLAVTAEMIERETRKDATLSQVYKATQTGWAASERSFLAPYFQRRDELAIDSGCLMWGMRIIIPTKQKLANVLFAYRNATHATTNRTPAMLFLGRGLRSRLDLLKPNLRRTVMDRQIKQGKGLTIEKRVNWKLDRLCFPGITVENTSGFPV
uniref:Uncharacterized protein n=1 Tax=Knipowitschia caucasica TaxID=637954 RepID=A0AAV2JT00_KNICA